MELTDGGAYSCHSKNDFNNEYQPIDFIVHVTCELNRFHGYTIINNFLMNNAPTNNRITTYCTNYNFKLNSLEW